MVVVHSFDAPEQAFVQHDVVGVFGEDGRHLLCQRVEEVCGFGTEQVEEDGGHPVKELSASFHCLDGVGEGGRIGVVDNALYFLVFLFDAFAHGWLVVCLFDAVEGNVGVCVVEWIHAN